MEKSHSDSRRASVAFRVALALSVFSFAAILLTSSFAQRRSARPQTQGSPATPAATPYCSLDEDFQDIDTLPPGWFFRNNSEPIGVQPSWFQGDPSQFPSIEGSNDYIAADVNNAGPGDPVAIISNWLLTPELKLENGATLTFYTRTVDNPIRADRLQVRMSTQGASTNVGTSSTSVGDFRSEVGKRRDVDVLYSHRGQPDPG